MRLFTDHIAWVQVRDGDLRVLKLFKRHYSKINYKDGRKHTRFVGPGQRIVLVHLGEDGEADAIFVWRKFKDDSGQVGINNSIFRNESKIQSSDLILQAESIASVRWPGERLYTYINPRKIKSTNPGFCYKIAGWRLCGETKRRKLLIFEKWLR